MTNTAEIPYPLGPDGTPTPADAQAALEQQTPPYLALAEELPGDTGWKITVLRTCDATHAETITLPGWVEFRAASAGHRLIEYGYMVPTAAHFAPNRVAGWHKIPGHGWSAPAVNRADQVGGGDRFRGTLTLTRDGDAAEPWELAVCGAVIARSAEFEPDYDGDVGNAMEWADGVLGERHHWRHVYGTDQWETDGPADNPKEK